MQAGPADRAAPRAGAVGHAESALQPPDGEQIYNTRCMSCHQMNGKGVPGTFPPLTDTDWVNGDKGRLIRLLLHGVSGRMEVKGQTYSGVMPPWGGALDDAGVAAVLTYIRTNFGNDTTAVTAEEVAKVRAATKGRKKPWTAKELEKPANQGIPGEATAAGE
jgi:mono/diheme cytochrome c family protein